MTKNTAEMKGSWRDWVERSRSTVRCGKVWDSTMENALRKVNSIPGRPWTRRRSRPTARRRPGRRGCAQKRDRLEKKQRSDCSAHMVFLCRKYLFLGTRARRGRRRMPPTSRWRSWPRICYTQVHTLTAGSGQISATTADAVGEAT